MKQATMIFKYPGSMHVCNVTKEGFNYRIVDAGEEGAIDKALQQGWFLSTTEAKAAADAPVLETPVETPADAPVLETPMDIDTLEPVKTNKPSKKSKSKKGDFL